MSLSTFDICFVVMRIYHLLVFRIMIHLPLTYFEVLQYLFWGLSLSLWYAKKDVDSAKRAKRCVKEIGARVTKHCLEIDNSLCDYK